MAKTPTNSELDVVVSYMTISLGYYFNIILPYKDGVALLAALEKAEPIERHSGGSTVVFTDDKPDVVIHTVTQKEYREQKMIKLLGVQDDAT